MPLPLGCQIRPGPTGSFVKGPGVMDGSASRPSIAREGYGRQLPVHNACTSGLRRLIHRAPRQPLVVAEFPDTDWDCDAPWRTPSNRRPGPSGEVSVMLEQHAATGGTPAATAGLGGALKCAAEPKRRLSAPASHCGRAFLRPSLARPRFRRNLVGWIRDGGQSHVRSLALQPPRFPHCGSRA